MEGRDLTGATQLGEDREGEGAERSEVTDQVLAALAASLFTEDPTIQSFNAMHVTGNLYAVTVMRIGDNTQERYFFDAGEVEAG